jgi:hypothetical protein
MGPIDDLLTEGETPAERKARRRLFPLVTVMILLMTAVLVAGVLVR